MILRDEQDALSPPSRRTVVFDDWSGEVPIYRRSEPRAGSKLIGPAVIVEYGSTTILPPYFRLQVDPMGNLVIEGTGGDQDGG